MERLHMLNVTILAFLLILTGCFGATSGDAEAEETENSTIINNYYNNTTVIQEPSLHHVYSNGTITIFTNANQLVEIVSSYYYPARVYSKTSSLDDPLTYCEGWNSCTYSHTNVASNSIDADVTCNSFTSPSGTNGYLLSDGGSCTYTFTNQWNFSYYDSNWEFTEDSSPIPTSWPAQGPMAITYIIHDTI